MSKRLVIALGGNALGNNPKEQLELVKNTASTIVDLVEEGYDVVIGHGNGPQVGMVNLAFEYAHNNDGLFGWSVSNVEAFETPMLLSDFGFQNAPQNWRYIYHG